MTDEQIKEEIKHINTRNQEYIAVNNRMTKKIIDGVDVSECEKLYWDIAPFLKKEERPFHQNEWKCGGGFTQTYCHNNKNCLYKQLKRKEQECEELKKEIAFGNNGTLSDKIRAEVFKELNNENNQLKAENEELKKKIKYMEEYIKTVENSRNEFEKESKFLKEEIQKL